MVFQGSGRPQPNTLGAPEVFLVALCSAHRQGPRPRCLGSSFRLSVPCPVSPCFSKRFPPAHCGLLGTGLAHSGPRKAGPPTLWLVLFGLFSVYDVVCVSVRG